MGHLEKTRRRNPAFQKGRQVEETALNDLAPLFRPADFARDRLIENLHAIQDRFGHLSVDHLAALARLMKMSQAEVYEVASFYHHFNIVKDSDTPPLLTVRVCESLTCHMNGGEALLNDLQGELGDSVRLVPGPCMGACDKAPAVAVGETQVVHADVSKIWQQIKVGGVLGTAPETDFDFTQWREILGGSIEREALIATVEGSGLRGLGGAGFPTARKWSFFKGAPKPRYLAVNADEGEPGTFKDRWCIENHPARVLTGALIAAWAIEASAIYIYLRDEYPEARRILQAAIAALEAEGLTGGMEIDLRRGAGAYICGEESALLESLEGKRGLPRHKPPYPAQAGLFGQPTLINNVETLYWLPEILERGSEWFVRQGVNGATGLRLYSVSGRVREPGVKCAPAGLTVRQLIDEYCGGMADGHDFTAYLPGGASGGILPAFKDDIPLDFGKLEAEGCFIGSAAVVILSQADDVKDIARNLVGFFADESCGQCTPCRSGTVKALKMMEADSWDEPLLRELSQAMRDASICGLGQAAPNPLLSVLNHFKEAER